jgi:hypothetical protein
MIIDYRYPRLNAAVIGIRLVRKDDGGAAFVADRRTRIGRRVRVCDRYDCHRDLVIERTYEGSPSARSTWTIHPVDAARCTLPFLKRPFYRINFTPFIHDAERRATEATA